MKKAMREFRFVNYVLTVSEHDNLEKKRKQLARGIDPLSVSLLLEWFYLQFQQKAPNVKKNVATSLNMIASKFEFPSYPDAVRSSARVDAIVIDWLTKTTNSTANKATSSALVWLSKNGTNLDSNLSSDMEVQSCKQ